VILKLSLESRLNFSIAFIMLLIIGLGFGWAIRDARESVRREAGASVGLALGLIDAALLAGDLKPSALHGWVQKISHIDRIRHLRIAVTSNESFPPMARGMAEQGRPNDGVPDWFRWAVVSEPIVMVREVRFGPEPPVLVHVESYAEDEIREAWEEAQGFLVLQGVLLLAIYGAVHLLVGRAVRPVAPILKGLNAIEQGDYDARLPRFGLSELDRISAGINHLSSSLKASRDEIRALTRHSLSIQEEERRSIAQEIHDEFGQNLTAIKMMSGAMGSHSSAEVSAGQEIQRLCDRLFGVVRSLMRRLRPMVLEDLGLNAAISDLRDHWQNTSPDLEIVFHCDSVLEELRGDISLEIYRIIQEALTNTLRHSGATQSRISIEEMSPKTIQVIIEDNGRGISQSDQQRGFGLLGMRERVASLKGQFKLINRPGQGLEIRIVLPFKNTQDD
jgi:two-component system, NarL family, sensor histidine kinase UhpB